MAARLTDKQKKKIIADYVELGSYNAVARKHGVSNHTVKRIALGEAETSKKVQHKKSKTLPTSSPTWKARRARSSRCWIRTSPL